MKKNTKEALNIFFRYILIILAGLGNLYIFYLIFTPLTIYPLKFILSLFSPVILIGNTLFFNENTIEIISACVAGAAYYLIFILTLSSNSLSLKKTIKILLFCFVLFLILNLARILLLVSLIGTKLFDITHVFFWYFISTLFVVLIWIASVKIFNIKSIPVYTDIKKLIKILFFD